MRGGSAGGFTVLAVLARRDTFTAGVSYFGVSDLAALARDTHKFESRYLDRLVGPLPDAVDVYAARSPLSHLEGFSCPLLLLQGLDDEVVPPAQSEAIVDALAERGIPHAYLSFEGEGHGFRRAENQLRCLTAELSFYGQVFGFTRPERWSRSPWSPDRTTAPVAAAPGNPNCANAGQHVTCRMALTSRRSRLAMAAGIRSGGGDEITPRRSASCLSSGMIGSEPYAPVPMISWLPLHGMSSSADSGVAIDSAVGFRRFLDPLAHVAPIDDDVVLDGVRLSRSTRTRPDVPSCRSPKHILTSGLAP